jgi:outer membrane immunogenic protein
MRRYQVPLLAAVVVIGFASIAYAADMAVKAPPPPPAPVYSWTGFYIGGNAGWAWEQSRLVNFSTSDPGGGVPGLANVVGPGSPISFGASGSAAGGFQVGYNWQFNRAWLFGLESDIDFLHNHGSSGTSTTVVTGLGPFIGSANQSLDWFGTVRARVGYLPTNALLVYGTGGLAYGTISSSANYFNASGISVGIFNGGCVAGTYCYAGTSASTANGWTAGGGLEYSLSKNWTIKAEYLYVNLGTHAFNENVLPSFFASTASSTITANWNDIAFHLVRGGVNYKF